MAINAIDGGGVARLTVEHAIAMYIQVEVAIAALHPVREMDVF